MVKKSSFTVLLLLLGWFALPDYLNAQSLDVTSVQKVSNKSGGLGKILFSNEWFSERVANIGDLNGDGVSDLACSAAGDHDGGDRNGAIFILFMNSDGTVKSKQKISENNGNLNLTFPSSEYFFGYSVSGIGDLNGDGTNDLAVGIITGNDSYTGAVAILFMKSDGTVKSTTLLDKSNTLLSGYLTGGNFFGCGIQGIGDINGDGVNDIAVGAQSEENSKGATYILFLKSDGTLKSVTRLGNNSSGVPDILSASDNFGVSISNLGDIDGDGVNDIALGSYGDNEVATNTGCVYIARLKSDGTVKKLSKINTLSNTIDNNSGSNFGNSVCSIKDLDGDGHKDLLVGAINDGTNKQGALYIVYLDSNADAKSYQKISSQTSEISTYLSSGDRFGCGIAPFDNYDSNFSIVVGASGDNDDSTGSGSFYVIHLKSTKTLLNSYVDNDFHFSPNPTQNYIQISSASGIGDAQTNLYDISGKNVGEFVDRRILSIKSIAIDLSSLKPGIYFLQIIKENQLTNYKIIKN